MHSHTSSKGLNSYFYCWDSECTIQSPQNSRPRKHVHCIFSKPSLFIHSLRFFKKKPYKASWEQALKLKQIILRPQKQSHFTFEYE